MDCQGPDQPQQTEHLQWAFECTYTWDPLTMSMKATAGPTLTILLWDHPEDNYSFEEASEGELTDEYQPTNTTNTGQDTMNIDDMTIKQAREISALFSSTTPATATPFAALVGKAVFVRTVTYHYTGRLVAVESGQLVLEDAAWVGDSGRWHVALRDGTLSEVEPYPAGRVYVNASAVVDVSEWNHSLPRSAK